MHLVQLNERNHFEEKSTSPLLHTEKTIQKSCITQIFYLIVFMIALIFLTLTFFNSHGIFSAKEIAVGVRRLWNLLKDVRIQDVNGVPRSWSEFVCSTSEGSSIIPRCEGKQHSCILANLIFEQFRTLYTPKRIPGISPPSFPHTTFSMSNTQGTISHENREKLVSQILQHAVDASNSRHHLMWLVEVKPDHAFIVEQSSEEFRLYQSWMHGFDINYWLSEARTDEACYEHNWGKFQEFKYDKEKDKNKIMQSDLETLAAAKLQYGSHKVFGQETFEEILTKLSYGWTMTKDIHKYVKLRSAIREMEGPPLTPVREILNQKPQWSLKHIFGLEPICLKSLEENRPLVFELTVQSLDLGTEEMVEQIESKQTELQKMSEMPLIERLDVDAKHIHSQGPSNLPPHESD